jgi:hypothetical protein
VARAESVPEQLARRLFRQDGPAAIVRAR